VRENISRFGGAQPQEIIEAAALAGLHDAILRLPRAMTAKSARPDSSSPAGGASASPCALFGPAAVVLDEPNASLDHQDEEALDDAIERIKDIGTTAVMIAHRPGALGLADKLLALRRGMICAYGAREDVTRMFDAGQSTVPQAFIGRWLGRYQQDRNSFCLASPSPSERAHSSRVTDMIVERGTGGPPIDWRSIRPPGAS
jgi:ABC-type protease/lipase transport system fused ATPase/permease subunit